MLDPCSVTQPSFQRYAPVPSSTLHRKPIDGARGVREEAGGLKCPAWSVCTPALHAVPAHVAYTSHYSLRGHRAPNAWTILRGRGRWVLMHKVVALMCMIFV